MNIAKGHILSIFPAFYSRNFRLYFGGQLVSLVGNWLQIVAEGWLVLTITNSAFLIGLVAAAATLPTLLFSLFGGVIVDRFETRKVIIATQILSMILALTYGLLTVFHLINIWEIIILAFLLGTVAAVDFPARQTFTMEMVGKKYITSAVAVNAGTFNTARVIGPTIAGFLIVIVGSGGAFIVNGLSYIPVIITLVLMNVDKKPPHVPQHPIKAIKEGVSYAYAHPTIRSLLIFTSVVSIFGWSYTTLMPLIAKNIFHTGAGGLGMLYAAVGLGAVISTIIVSGFSTRFSPMRFIIIGNTLFALGMIAFTYTNHMITALPILFIAGLGLLSEFAVLNTTIQHLVSDRFRGRVLSLYILVFVGLFPLGNFQVGFVAEHFGPENAIRYGAIIVLLAGICLFLVRNRIRRMQEKYLEETIPLSESDINP